MAYMSEEEKERMRQNGRSEHEIAYYDAEGQKEYEPLLRDPSTPSELIDRMVDSITLIPLKILAFKHPNVTSRSQRYMLEKADKKPYYNELLEAFFSNEKDLPKDVWIKFRKNYNTAGRLDLATITLMEEQKDVFTTSKLKVILNSFADTGLKSTKVAERYLLAIFEHKNFDVSILDGELCREAYIFHNTDMLNALNATKRKEEIFVKLYEITGDADWLPTSVKDIFLF